MPQRVPDRVPAFPSSDRGPALRRALTGLAFALPVPTHGTSRRLFIWLRNLCEARVLNLFGRDAETPPGITVPTGTL